MLTEGPPYTRWIRGTLDALAAPHGIDRYLEALRPAWALDRPRATVERVMHPTPRSVTLQLRPNRCWRGFAAGQHVALSLEIEGVRHTRCYSLAGSAHRRHRLELTIRRQPEGRVSGWLNDHAAPGLVLDLDHARGDFVLPEPRPDRLLLISGGSGITPVLSMLRTLCDEDHRGPVTFLHYAASEAEMPYAGELARLAGEHPNLRLVRVFQAEPEAGELRGRFAAEQLAAAEPGFERAETFVCGPERLMEAVRRVYVSHGLEARLHQESFHPPRYAIRSDAAGSRVTFERSGITRPSDGRTLLEQAESAGLAPQHGCRRGVCHTCTRRMTAGALRHVVTGETFSATDVDVQLCVHAPAGDVVIDL